MSAAAERAQHAEAQRRYRATHAEQERERAAAYVQRVRPWTATRGRASRFAHQANVRASSLGNTARLTATAVRAIVGPCAYCGGGQSGWDHAIPLIRGGENTVANLVPCCEACNTAKAHRTPAEFAAGAVVRRPWRAYRSRVGSTLREERSAIRSAISDAYYDARNAGRTMEDAADDAVEAVLSLFPVELREMSA